MKRKLIISAILLFTGCQTSFIPEDETGTPCPQTGLVFSGYFDETNYYHPQYYQVDETSKCQRRRCIEDKWVGDTDYTCDYSCRKPEEQDNPLNFDYCGECLGNEQRCDGNTIQHCENGRWKSIKDCENINDEIEENKSSCIKIDDIASCGTCLNGKHKYLNQNNACTHLICNNAHWELDTNFTCPSIDNENIPSSCHTNAEGVLDGCGECRNEDIKCNDKNILKCLGGSWAPMQTCVYSCSQIDNGTQFICGECNNSSEKIYWEHPDNGTCVSSTCNNGIWINDYNECPSGSCIFENDIFKECGECLNGSSKCDGNIYKLCQNGTYKDILACDSCDNNICIKSCSEVNKCTQDTDEIATFCNANGQIEFCPAGCTSDNLCMNCKEGEEIFKEEDDICFYRSCQNNLFPEAYTKCTDNSNKGVSCTKDGNNKFSCGECKNGNKKCEQTGSSCKCQICQNGTWRTLCENNNSCKGAADNYTGCGECTNGTTNYYQEGTTCKYKQCSNGTWQAPSTCPSNNSCTAANDKCGECVNGNHYSEASSICVYKKCIAGKWESKDFRYTCPNSYSCNKNRTACGVCRNKTTKCENSRLFTCTDGAWPTTGTYCPKGCNSNGEKCKS